MVFLTSCESRTNDDSPFHQAALVSASSASRQTKRDGQGHLGLFEQARSRLVRQERHPLGILGSRAHAGGCRHLAKILTFYGQNSALLAGDNSIQKTFKIIKRTV